MVVKLFSPQTASTISYAKITDTQSSGTNGGTFTAGSYVTRALNTIEFDPDGIIKSLSANRFTLDPGKYIIKAYAPAAFCDAHKTRIRNVTDSNNISLGVSADQTNSSARETGFALVEGYVDISAQKSFEIQHRCGITATTFGLGEACGFGDDENYATVSVLKIG